MSKSIPLTRGYTTLVDESDYAWLSQSKWLYIGSGYAARFVRLNGKSKLLYLHRVLLQAEAAQRVDHINGNRLDNQRQNLRLVTLSQNQQNRKPPTDSVSRYKGVCWYRCTGKWHVRITTNQVRIHLGYYEDLETAARLYDAAARHFFGPYARPNRPETPTSAETEQLLTTLLQRRADGKHRLNRNGTA